MKQQNLEGDAGIILNMLTAGKSLALGERNEATIGRITKGQPIVPDIDLTPFNAYESGVSRMHVSLKEKDDQITVTDLGSANGTRINGKKISAQIAYQINPGDILTLGKFKIQILLSKKSVGG